MRVPRSLTRFPAGSFRRIPRNEMKGGTSAEIEVDRRRTFLRGLRVPEVRGRLWWKTKKRSDGTSSVPPNLLRTSVNHPACYRESFHQTRLIVASSPCDRQILLFFLVLRFVFSSLWELMCSGSAIIFLFFRHSVICSDDVVDFKKKKK